LELRLRPLSFIIALDEFDFMYLPHRNAKRCDIITDTVRPGEMIVFTNSCLHAGGSNRHDKRSNRIFGYVCNNDSDIPVGKVFPHKWSSQDEDALIVEDSGDERILSVRDRPRRTTAGRERHELAGAHSACFLDCGPWRVIDSRR